MKTCAVSKYFLKKPNRKVRSSVATDLNVCSNILIIYSLEKGKMCSF